MLPPPPHLLLPQMPDVELAPGLQFDLSEISDSIQEKMGSLKVCTQHVTEWDGCGEEGREREGETDVKEHWSFKDK